MKPCRSYTRLLSVQTLSWISAGAPSAQRGFPPFAGDLGNTFGTALRARCNVIVAPAPDNILNPNT